MKPVPTKLVKRRILIGLSIHWAVWCIWLSAMEMRGTWSHRWQQWLEIGVSDIVDWVVSPFTFGRTFMSGAEFHGWAALRVLITIALIAMTYFAVRTQRPRTVVLAHCTVLFYWVASMAIVFSEILAEAHSF